MVSVNHGEDGSGTGGLKDGLAEVEYVFDKVKHRDIYYSVAKARVSLRETLSRWIGASPATILNLSLNIGFCRCERMDTSWWLNVSHPSVEIVAPDGRIRGREGNVCGSVEIEIDHHDRDGTAAGKENMFLAWSELVRLPAGALM